MPEIHVPEINSDSSSTISVRIKKNSCRCQTPSPYLLRPRATCPPPPLPKWCGAADPSLPPPPLRLPALCPFPSQVWHPHLLPSLRRAKPAPAVPRTPSLFKSQAATSTSTGGGRSSVAVRHSDASGGRCTPRRRRPCRGRSTRGPGPREAAAGGSPRCPRPGTTCAEGPAAATPWTTAPAQLPPWRYSAPVLPAAATPWTTAPAQLPPWRYSAPVLAPSA
jgi:hypothetical protein